MSVILVPGIALADGGLPCRFSGSVTVGGSDVPGGSLIEAIIEGDKYFTHTPRGSGSSSYSLVLPSPEGRSYPEGARVDFWVEGYKADQSGAYMPGQNIDLDLTASGASLTAPSDVDATPQYAPPSSDQAPFNWWVIGGPCLALMMGAGIAYYYSLLNRGIKKRAARNR
jgi:hypothetical protein